MKNYYYVANIDELKHHIEQLNEGLAENNYVGGRIVFADGPEAAKIIFLKEEYIRNPVTDNELYRMFLEDFCYYEKYRSLTNDVSSLFSLGKDIIAVEKRLPTAEAYEIGFEPEVEAEMLQLCPYDELLCLFPTESDKAMLYALANGYKMMSCG